MFNSTILSLDEIKKFLGLPNTVKFKSKSTEERNSWIQKALMQNRYFHCLKPNKTLIRKYIRKATGLSKSQLTRLINSCKTRGTLKPKEYRRYKFPKIYGMEDIALLADTDNAHRCLSGQATKKIIEDEFNIFNKTKYKDLKDISVSHLYRLRQTRRYREKVKIFSKTRPTKVPIGERRKPEPNGRPGYLCVDTVHQGDNLGQKGVYHIGRYP
jgi:hypothetical protein